MATIDIDPRQTVRLSLSFDGPMTGHSLALSSVVEIVHVTVEWTDIDKGEAELLIESAETATWTPDSRPHLSIDTIAPNGDVEPWGTLAFSVGR